MTTQGPPVEWHAINDCAALDCANTAGLLIEWHAQRAAEAAARMAELMLQEERQR
jgi:hypothetical protein